MRYCGSFLVVELMRQGMHPEEACLEALRRIARKDPKGMGISVSFVALDNFKPEYLSIFSRDVLKKIAAGDEAWESMVPTGVSDLIRKRHFFGCTG